MFIINLFFIYRTISNAIKFEENLLPVCSAGKYLTHFMIHIYTPRTNCTQKFANLPQFRSR